MNDIDFIFNQSNGVDNDEKPRFDFSNFFSVDVTNKDRTAQMREFVLYYTKNGEKTQSGKRKIPREYYGFLCELMSYRYDDPRNKINREDISTMFIGKDAYNNNTLMFYTKNSNSRIPNTVGVSSCLTCVQRHVNNILKKRHDDVIGILRDLIRNKIRDIKNNIVFPTKSELSGVIINEMSQVAIDHYDDDFVKVAFDWLYIMKKELEKHRGKLVDICNELSKMIDYDNKCFKIDKLNKSFVDFHDAHTHLRVVTKTENLKREKTNVNWDLLKINGRYIERYEKQKLNK